MLTIGLTGGIGSGKTTVAQLFAQYGITIIDADCIAHALVQPGEPALQQIATYFGPQILDEQGRLQRNQLRQQIFQSPKQRQWLEALLHPLVRQRMATAVQQATSPYCLLVIPLLLETPPNPLIDRILVVDTTPELQIQRTQQRDNNTPEQIQRIIAIQVSRQTRLAAADDIIINSADRQTLATQVAILHQRYLTLALWDKPKSD